MKLLFIGGRFKASLESSLKEKGYEVNTARTKLSADKYLNRKYDLYIVDSFGIGTFEPERDGFIEVIKSIFEKDRKSKVIVYTDNSNVRDSARFLPYKVPVESKNRSIESLIEKYSK